MKTKTSDIDLVRIKTPQGIVIGVVEEVSDGDTVSEIAVYKGIPYAIPPTGARRWQHARYFEGWLGERTAFQYAPACNQKESEVNSGFFYLPNQPMSEDCLYLNVWSPLPKAKVDSGKPVMVWIHGGGLLTGSASLAPYDARELAKKDVVVVTINYRLGIFGFFSHPELSQETEYSGSGNYGLTDQILALKWVKRNISAFGGDPGNITLFGQSAGALSISCLLVSPLTEGLFHRAIMQSPYMPPLPRLRDASYGWTEEEVKGSALQMKAGKRNIEQLRNASASELLKAAEGISFDKAVVDDFVLKNQVFTLLERGDFHQVPIIVGFNYDEGSYFLDYSMVKVPETKTAYESIIVDGYGDWSDQYLNVYSSDNLMKSVSDGVGHGLYGWAALKMASTISTCHKNIYLYHFNHTPKWALDKKMGAFHSADVIYSFNNQANNVKFSPNWPDYLASKSDQLIGNAMSDYWVSFAKNGVPGTNDLAEWKPYTNENGLSMEFGSGNISLQKNSYGAMFELHESIVNNRKKIGQYWSYDNIGLLASCEERMKVIKDSC